MTQKRHLKNLRRKANETKSLEKLNNYYGKIIKKYGEFDKRGIVFMPYIPGTKYHESLAKYKKDKLSNE